MRLTATTTHMNASEFLEWAELTASTRPDAQYSVTQASDGQVVVVIDEVEAS